MGGVLIGDDRIEILHREIEERRALRVRCDTRRLRVVELRALKGERDPHVDMSQILGEYVLVCVYRYLHSNISHALHGEHVLACMYLCTLEH